MNHLQGLSMDTLKAMLTEKIWALSDLEDLKNRGKYNEYVTVKNIDQWIAQAKKEVDMIEAMIKTN